jgi:hypothetical protein
LLLTRTIYLSSLQCLLNLDNSNLICDKIHDEVKLHFKIARSIDVGLESGTASFIENLKVYSKQLEINCYLQGLYIYRRYNACHI